MAEQTERSAPKIESMDLTLGDLFKDFYMVPDFQREYVWETENVEKLLRDIYDEFYDDGTHPTGDSEYFIGSIVACPDDAGTFQLIDGQQRLTTLFLVICAVRDRLIELGQQETVALQGFIKSVTMDRRTMADISRYRLTLQYEDSHGVLETIADAQQPVSGIVHSTESIKHIVAAYDTIREFLSVEFRDDVERVKEFFASFMYRVKLIRIVTPNLAHALKVFETINDRGVSLNAMDLLKNLLFMRTEATLYPKLKERWKELTDTLGRAGEKPLRFLRYFIVSQFDADANKPLREDEIYNWIVRNSVQCGIDTNPTEFLNQMVRSARAYENFLAGKDMHGTFVPFIQNISLLAGGAVRQHLIVLLAGQHLRSDLFVELCRNVENLFFCYLITREQTKMFERTLVRAATRLRNVQTDEDLDAFLKEVIHPELASRLSLFEFALTELSQSKIQQYRLRYILAKMTQFIERAAFGNPAHDSLLMYINSKVEIEHILPQTPTPEAVAAFDKPEQYFEYLERLGNLTLLERPINSANSNRTFADKKIGYRESHFLLTKALDKRPVVGKNSSVNRAVGQLPEFDGWDSHAIEQRQQALVRLARRVWMADIDVASIGEHTAEAPGDGAVEESRLT